MSPFKLRVMYFMLLCMYVIVLLDIISSVCSSAALCILIKYLVLLPLRSVGNRLSNVEKVNDFAADAILINRT